MIPDPLMETDGPVDSLTLETASFTKKGLSWKEGPRQPAGRYSWDGEGRLVSVENEDETRLYAYNETGLETACYRLDAEGNVLDRELKEWDPDSRLLRSILHTAGSDTEEISNYEHDDAGRMTAERRGQRVRVEKKDREGRIVQVYLYDGETPDLVTDYEWDEFGRPVSETVKDPDGRTHRVTAYTWGSDGRLESLTVADSDGRLLRDETYAYGASLGKRWLERVTWIPDGGRKRKRRPSEVVYRSFTLGDEVPREEPVRERTMAFANGVYTGPLVEGSPEGTGIFRYNDESVYRGEFRGGVMSGRGELSWPDGRRMEGAFANGLLEGSGSCTWTDGSRYDGEFLNGRMHGAGVFTWADGTRFEGLFDRGKRTDQGAWEKI